MSPEQAKKLVEVESDRFAFFMGGLFWDKCKTKDPCAKGCAVFDVSGQCNFETGLWAMCFWMLQTMRARYDELYERLRMEGDPFNSKEYMALDDFMGTEATSLDEDAVINAYISWKEQTQ